MHIKKIIFGMAIGALVVGSVAFAEPWTEPSGTPLGSNVSPTVTTGTGASVKTGTFWAESVGSDAGAGGGFCFGTDCRTAWPTSTPKRCHLEWKEVRASASEGYADFTDNIASGLCDDLLTPASVAAGWVATGNEYCIRIGSSDCQRPRSCIYTRLQCSGLTVTAPAKELLTHPASDPADEFQTANPSGGCAYIIFNFCIPS